MYFWDGLSGPCDNKWLPLLSNHFICERFVSHKNPWIRVVSPDLAVILRASMWLAALDCVDSANTMVTKHMEAGGGVLECK